MCFNRVCIKKKKPFSKYYLDITNMAKLLKTITTSLNEFPVEELKNLKNKADKERNDTWRVLSLTAKLFEKLNEGETKKNPMFLNTVEAVVNVWSNSHYKTLFDNENAITSQLMTNIHVLAQVLNGSSKFDATGMDTGGKNVRAALQTVRNSSLHMRKEIQRNRMEAKERRFKINITKYND